MAKISKNTVDLYKKEQTFLKKLKEQYMISLRNQFLKKVMQNGLTSHQYYLEIKLIVSLLQETPLLRQSKKSTEIEVYNNIKYKREKRSQFSEQEIQSKQLLLSNTFYKPILRIGLINLKENLKS